MVLIRISSQILTAAIVRQCTKVFTIESEIQTAINRSFEDKNYETRS